MSDRAKLRTPERHERIAAELEASGVTLHVAE